MSVQKHRQKHRWSRMRIKRTWPMLLLATIALLLTAGYAGWYSYSPYHSSYSSSYSSSLSASYYTYDYANPYYSPYLYLYDDWDYREFDTYYRLRDPGYASAYPHYLDYGLSYLPSYHAGDPYWWSSWRSCGYCDSYTWWRYPPISETYSYNYSSSYSYGYPYY